MDLWASARGRVECQFRSGIDALILLVIWMIWKERNARVFERRSATPQQLKSKILAEAFKWDRAERADR
ncbi:hypothetical protein BS78_01G015900 [Paspalum vaginatum]|nr:hypothetical protein BS78_01G015900 [Paspalum vaginatum]